MLAAALVARRTRPRLILALACSVFLIQGLVFGGMIWALLHWPPAFNGHSLPQAIAGDLIVYRAPYVRIGEFVIGITAGTLFLTQRRWTVGVRNIAATVAVAGIFSVMYGVPVKQGYGSPASALMFVWAYMPFFALFIYASAQGKHMLSVLLDNRVMLKLGEASYALYILHIPILDLLQAAGLRLRVCFVITIAISVICYEFLESPIRRLLALQKTVPRLPAITQEISLAKLDLSLRA